VRGRRRQQHACQRHTQYGPCSPAHDTAPTHNWILDYSILIFHASKTPGETMQQIAGNISRNRHPQVAKPARTGMERMSDRALPACWEASKRELHAMIFEDDTDVSI
jgi:hypothetical protein